MMFKFGNDFESVARMQANRRRGDSIRLTRFIGSYVSHSVISKLPVARVAVGRPIWKALPSLSGASPLRRLLSEHGV